MDNWRFYEATFGEFMFGVGSLDASSSPLEWINRLELSLEIAEEDVLSSSVALVDEGGMALIKGRVYGEGEG